MRAIFCAVLLCVSCGSPQDQNKDSKGPNGEGPENGAELSLESSSLTLTACETVKDGKCDKHTKGDLNEVGYKQNNVKSVTRNFTLVSESDTQLELNDFEFVTLSCKYRVDRDASPFSSLSIFLNNGDTESKVDAADVLSVKAGVEYTLRISVENIYHCSDNWVRFSAITH